MAKKIPSELVIGIILILAIIIGGFVWLGGRNIKQPKPVQKQEAKKEVPNNNQTANKIDDTADWQTYRNEKYGFEVKYPGDWKQDIRIDDKDGRFDGRFSADNNKEGYTLRIKINLFGEVAPLLPEYPFVNKYENVNIFGNNIKKIIFSSEKKSELSILSEFCLNKELKIKNPKSNRDIPDWDEAGYYCDGEGYNLYSFNLFCRRDSIEENCSELFNQILSTFKFIN